MRGPLLVVLACAFAGVVAAPAVGQSALAPLFVSPMGEPFRGEAEAPPPIGLWFAKADGDADGRMAQAEYLADALTFFARVDINSDGVATSVESQTLWLRAAPELFAEHRTDQEEAGSRRRRQMDMNANSIQGEQRSASAARAQRVMLRGAQPYGLLNDAEPVMSCDRNFDRRVVRMEFEACAAQRFAIIDSNHDGFFEPSEAQLAYPREREED